MRQRVIAYITNAPPGVTFEPVLREGCQIEPLPPRTSQAAADEAECRELLPLERFKAERPSPN